MSKDNTSQSENSLNHGQNYHAVNLSGGKDSSALLLLMIERGMPIDVVLWADTGMDFPEILAHIAKLDDYLYRKRGLHYNGPLVKTTTKKFIVSHIFPN